MCGICGICMTEPGAPVPRPLLERMTTTLAHRGPDGQGLLVHGNVGFGDRRLSIIDLEGGDQPIYNETGDVGVVFNGEIYNYVELIADLKRRGHRFRTRSDTETIVHLYEEYGEACVEHLRGMFTFAIWDQRSRNVFLARDRLGIKPLFYALRDDRLIFASELKALVQDPVIVRNVNTRAVAEYLCYGYVPGDTCILKNVSKLAPGHTLTWSDGRASVRQYWDVTLESDDDSSPDQYAGELDDILREATRLHLRSDVPVGVFLSGGVDSSAVVALATRQKGQPVKTFSIGFDEADFSELASARITADSYKTEHHETIVRDQDISILPEIVWHLDEPFADPSALPTYYVCREAAKHVKVCLSGDGADEIFAGYNRYLAADTYRYFDWLPARLRRAVCTPIAAIMPQALWGKGFVHRIAAEGAERYLESVGVFAPRECRAVLGRGSVNGTPLTRNLDPYFADRGRATLTSLQHADQKTYLPDDILVKVDRMAMQSALEVRPPFLDHRVVEFANRCPPAWKIRNGSGKAVFKQVMRDHVPAETLQRKKKGFGIPIKHWFRGTMDTWARETLLSENAPCHRFFDRGTIERLIEGHQRGMRDLSRKIWSLIVFDQWCRRFEV